MAICAFCGPLIFHASLFQDGFEVPNEEDGLVDEEETF